MLIFICNIHKSKKLLLEMRDYKTHATGGKALSFLLPSQQYLYCDGAAEEIIRTCISHYDLAGNTDKRSASSRVTNSKSSLHTRKHLLGMLRALLSTVVDT